MRSSAGPLLGAVLASALTVLAGVGLMATASTLLATAALHPPLYRLMLLVTGVRFFGTSRGFFRYLERLLAHDATFRYLARLRTRLFAALIPRVPAAARGLASGRLQERLIGDVGRLESVPVRLLVPLGAALAVLAAVGLGLGRLHPGLGAVFGLGFLVATVPIPALGYLTAVRLGPRRGALSEELRQAAGELAEGLPELLVYDEAGSRVRALGELARRQARLERQEAALFALGEALLELAAGAVLVGLFWIGAEAIRQGDFPARWLPAVVLSGFAAFEAARPLPQAGVLLAEAGAAWRRIGTLIALPDPAPEPARPRSRPRRHDLELRGAWVGYPGASEAVLRGADLALPERRQLWLAGPSGSGKSTVAWTWLRFLLPQRGEARLGGSPIAALEGTEARRALVYLDPHPVVFFGTVRENLRVADPEADEEALWRALEAALLAERVRRLPAGLDTPLGPGGVVLSGGEARRLAIARAVLKNAPVWLLDEPTEGLDGSTERALLRRLAELLRGRSALWISHRPLPGLGLPRYRLEGGRVRRA